MRTIPIVLAMALLAGCSAIAEKRWARLERQCEAYGFRQGTTEFSQCLQRADENDRAAMNANTQRALDKPVYTAPKTSTSTCELVGDKVTCRTKE